MEPDEITGSLEEIRAGLRVAELGGLGSEDAPAGFMPAELYRHVRTLLKAVEAVLAVHQPHEGRSGAECGNCLDAYGEAMEWPCETVQAVTRELLEKDPPDGPRHPR